MTKSYKVPIINHRPIKPIYTPKHGTAPASLKQKNLILSMCEKRAIKPPDTTRLTMEQASQLITAIMSA